MIHRVWLSAVTITCLGACGGNSNTTIIADDGGSASSDATPSSSGDTSQPGSGDATSEPVPMGECAEDKDCVAPATEPADCAQGTCDPILRTCSYRAKDADADGHRAASCKPTVAGKTIPVGDDCDDGDATTYPGAAEVCDGKDHTCGAPTGKCNCVNGTMQDCYTGPAGSAGVATCKGSKQSCLNGVWGTCDGQVLPVLAMSVPPDDTHPCDGTNYWCDPAGVTPGHCTQCLTTTTPKACGSASTCNAAATQTCTKTGTWDVCTPAPINTCAPTMSYACTTCSSLPIITAGQRVCTASCNFNGARCVPNNNQSTRWYAGDPIFKHNLCGDYTDSTNPSSSYWAVPDGTGACYVQYGPYATLPAGHYKVTFSVYGGSSGNIILDVTHDAGQCGGAYGGLCPVEVNPNDGTSTHNFTYLFDITSDCSANWEIRIFKKGTAGMLEVYNTDFSYVNP